MAENPSAFPQQPLGSDGLPNWEASPGMTLRDYFAGQAINATLLGDYDHGLGRAHGSVHDEKAVARAYRIADALMAERDRKPQP